jgi:heme exporter protein D
MMIPKLQCLYVFLVLYGGAILAIFIRAFPRRRLLAEIDKQRTRQAKGEPESRARRLLLAIPRQSRALKDLGNSIGNAPAAVQRQHRLFRTLNGITIALVVLLVVFSLVAHRVCEA